jgi:hypothetical protein
MIKGIFILNTMSFVLNTKIGLAILLLSLGKRFALGILRCLISNVLINYYYKSLFLFKTNHWQWFNQPGQVTSTFSAEVATRRQTRSSLAHCCYVYNNLFVMQDYVALSKPEVLLNYFKLILMHSSKPMTQKTNDAFVMIQCCVVYSFS